MPDLIRGSLVVLKRKCGKNNCRCIQGQLHETTALSYSFEGKTRILGIPDDDVPTVRAAIARYQKAAQELEKAALTGIKLLDERLKKDRIRRRRMQ